MATTSFTQYELENALGNEIGDDYSIRTSYSGRFMYGEICFGIVSDCPFDRVLVAVAQLDANVAHSCSVDCMGLGAITYFPGWVLPE